jgi:hypothetical protein
MKKKIIKLSKMKKYCFAVSTTGLTGLGTGQGDTHFSVHQQHCANLNDAISALSPNQCK